MPAEPTTATSRPLRRERDRETGALADAYFEALRTADRDGAERVARRAIATGLPLAEVHALVIAPAMEKIGALWKSGDVSVADEHLATAISQAVVAAIYPEALCASPGSGGTVLLAAIEGEHHGLGLRMAADLLEGQGHTVRLLGADVPLDSLLAAVDRFNPDLVGLSVSMPFNAPILREYLIALADLDARVLVGGRSIPSAIRESGVPCVASVLDLPDSLESIPRARSWKAELGESDPHLRQTLIGRATPTLPGSFESSLMETASEVAELARAAMRERYLYERLASIDPVTELPNRRAWDERLEQALEIDDACVAMVDVDRFKQINDALGHACGDRALREVGAVLSRALRTGDFLARFGGDEFAILINGVGIAEGAEIAERLRQAVERELDGETTISVGVAPLDHDGRAGTLGADRALYAAKAGGRNKVATASAHANGVG